VAIPLGLLFIFYVAHNARVEVNETFPYPSPDTFKFARILQIVSYPALPLVAALGGSISKTFFDDSYLKPTVAGTTMVDSVCSTLYVPLVFRQT
jgi:hypothetical protein